MFITLEGPDGTGKSTQARMLRDWLVGQGHKVVLTREPGGSDGAEMMRKIILSDEIDRLSPRAEILLFMAARQDHLDKTILPALRAGKIVICDRYVDSTRAYQGFGGGVGMNYIDSIHETYAMRDPDLTLVLDMPSPEAMDRLTSRSIEQQGSPDRFDDMEWALHERIRYGFRDIAETYPERCRIVDATGDTSLVASRIQAALTSSPAFRPGRMSGACRA